MTTLRKIIASDKQRGGRFFSRDTLKFWGQTLRDFRRVRLDDGREAVYSRRLGGSKDWGYVYPGVYSLGVFNPETGRVDGRSSAIDPDAYRAAKEHLEKEEDRRFWSNRR